MQTGMMNLKTRCLDVFIDRALRGTMTRDIGGSW
jgi:hypothetical protein